VVDEAREGLHDAPTCKDTEQQRMRNPVRRFRILVQNAPDPVDAASQIYFLGYVIERFNIPRDELIADIEANFTPSPTLPSLVKKAAILPSRIQPPRQHQRTAIHLAVPTLEIPFLHPPIRPSTHNFVPEYSCASILRSPS
jgi:hypothetical protein